MLCSTKELKGFALAARDGDIGHVRDAYFDDERWTIRHLVVNTGGWLSGRDVLISPHSIQGLDRSRRRVDVGLSRRQIEDAPGIETDKPVSRQHEISYYDYYGYPYYWGGAGLWGMDAYPMAGAPPVMPALRDPGLPKEAAEMAAREREAADPHLRSSNDVIGYDIQATDGAVGHIDDFLFDERSWAIRYAVVDTRNWLPGRLVLIVPQTIEGVDWIGRTARVKLTREAVKSSPPYDREAQLSDAEDERMRRHYESWI
jgi:uncharacterized protein YrrD